jgi:hypothetical protein
MEVFWDLPDDRNSASKPVGVNTQYTNTHNILEEAK